jgi:hypothetical protein
MVAIGSDRGAGLVAVTEDVESGADEALVVGVRADEVELGEAVEFANGVASGTMLFKSIGVWTDGVHSDGMLGLALAVSPTYTCN